MKSKKTIQILCFALLVVVNSCAYKQLKSELTLVKVGNPPGTIKIADNLYMDDSEIRNIDYLEYLHWLKSVYGATSVEYSCMYPDTSFWKKLDENFASLDSFYFTNPVYRKLSVYGVNPEQARCYTKWRSDRVMEFVLKKYEVLNHSFPLSRDSIFTIKKYFEGNYYAVKPSIYFTFFPEYMLLDSTMDTRFGFKNICRYKKQY